MKNFLRKIFGRQGEYFTVNEIYAGLSQTEWFKGICVKSKMCFRDSLFGFNADGNKKITPYEAIDTIKRGVLAVYEDLGYPKHIMAMDIVDLRIADLFNRMQDNLSKMNFGERSAAAYEVSFIEATYQDHYIHEQIRQHIQENFDTRSPPSFLR